MTTAEERLWRLRAPKSLFSGHIQQPFCVTPRPAATWDSSGTSLDSRTALKFTSILAWFFMKTNEDPERPCSTGDLALWTDPWGTIRICLVLEDVLSMGGPSTGWVRILVPGAAPASPAKIHMTRSERCERVEDIRRPDIYSEGLVVDDACRIINSCGEHAWTCSQRVLISQVR